MKRRSLLCFCCSAVLVFPTLAEGLVPSRTVAVENDVPANSHKETIWQSYTGYGRD